MSRRESGKKKKNIMIIAPKLSGGGAEKMVTLIASRLASEHCVFLVLLKNVETGYEYRLEGDVHCENLQDELARVSNRRNLPTIELLRRAIKQKKKKYRITHCISFLERSNYLNVMTKDREKVIISVRNCYSGKYGDLEKDPERRRQIMESLQRADVVAAISEGVRGELEESFGVSPERLKVIYNFCETEKIAALASGDLPDGIRNFTGGGKYIVNAGRLVPQKGQGYLIRVFEEILKAHPELRLVILGRGDLEEELRKEIRDKGLQDRILLAGFMPDPFPVIKGAEAFVCSSLYEGLGNVILECLACGTPVVSVDCPYGPRELLTGQPDYKEGITVFKECEYGILTPRLDGDTDTAVSEMAKAVCVLLDDPAKREAYAKKAVQRAGHFLPEEIFPKWEELLNESKGDGGK